MYPNATKDRFLNLLNFDAEKFLICTEVDVRKETEKPAPRQAGPDEIAIGGVKYYRMD